MSRETIADLRKKVDELEIEVDKWRDSSHDARCTISSLHKKISQLKAIATHYKSERDRIDAYLGAVLDSMAPRFIEAEPTDKQPGCSPVFTTERPDIRIERIEPPNRPRPTEPAQDSDYYHNLKRIDWESF